MSLRYTVFDSTGAFRFSRDRHGGFSPYGGVPGDRIGVDDAFFEADIHATAPCAFVYRFFKLDTAFAPIDTLIVPRYSRTPCTDLSPPPPYAPRLVFHLDPGGYVWYAVSTAYQVSQLAFSGDTVRSIARDFEPVTIADAERDSLVEATRRGNAEIGLPGSGREPDLPGRKPAIARLIVDSYRYLWVVPYGEVDGETRSLDVFDPNGKYLGSATSDFSIGLEPGALPRVARGTLIIIRDDNLYAVSFDDLDAPYVVRAVIRGR